MATNGTDSEAATARLDGTCRKVRFAKEVCVHREEVPLCETKGKQFAQRKSILTVGMCPLVPAANKKESEKQERATATKPSVAGGAAATTPKTYRPSQLQGAVLRKTNVSGVNNKTMNTKPTKATTKPAARNSNTCSNNNTNSPSKASATLTTLTNNLAEMQLKMDDDDRLSKELKLLKEQLREFEIIEAKIMGELKNPNKDQLRKVISNTKPYPPSHWRGGVLPKTKPISGVNKTMNTKPNKAANNIYARSSNTNYSNNTNLRPKTFATLTNNLSVMQQKKINDDRASNELKELKKHLREYEPIEARILSGELKELKKDQMAKVKQIKEFVKEMEKQQYAHR